MHTHAPCNSTKSPTHYILKGTNVTEGIADDLGLYRKYKSYYKLTKRVYINIPADDGLTRTHTQMYMIYIMRTRAYTHIYTYASMDVFIQIHTCTGSWITLFSCKAKQLYNPTTLDGKVSNNLVPVYACASVCVCASA